MSEDEIVFVMQNTAPAMKMCPGFYVPIELLNRVEVRCKELGINRSKFIREAMEEKIGKPITNKVVVPNHLKGAFATLELVHQLIELSDEEEIDMVYLDFRNKLALLYSGFAQARNAIASAKVLIQNYGVETIMEEDISEIPVPGTSRSRMDKRGFYLHFPEATSKKAFTELVTEIEKDLLTTGNVKV